MANKLKDFLRGTLRQEELPLVPSSFDIIGGIIVFSEFPKDLEKKERLIGEAILSNFKHIKSVFKKSRKYSGTFRVPKLKLIAGDKEKETEHKENNARIRLNVEKVYFSPRLSEERKRIFSQIKPGESVLVMFSGSGVYPIVIAKNSNPKEVYGIEINPTAHKYALENVRINKVDNKVKLFFGDAKKIMPKLNKKFDRILMPLPRGAENFLSPALNKLKKNGIIHFYSFSEENKYNNITRIIENECNSKKKKCAILSIVKCGQFSPKVNRICVDFRIL